ncbi:MAG: CoA-binding protein [Rhodospirillales bacterium]|nr:CoA-binding protein [Rhodospirillales bacterium]
MYSDELLRNILKQVKTIAMVGASANWVRPSNFAMKYLQGKGYRVIPVNPGQAGKEILGETVYASLSDIPDNFDMVDIFRNAAAAGPIMDEAIALTEAKGISVVWMQLGIVNEDAAQKGAAAGLSVIMDRCPKIEYARLFGELGWSGINTGVISSKRPKLRA